MSDENFLSRWSKRKIDARKRQDVPEAAPAAAETTRPPAAAVPEPTASEPLPPVESLTSDSDFSLFMRPQVDESLKRQALKTLFSDPRFNVMDGLDVYIDDYSKPDPLPEGWLEKMNQVARLGEYQAPEAEEAKESPATAISKAEEVPPEALGPPDAQPNTSDTDIYSQDASEVPESRGNDPRNPGHMV